MSHHGEWWPIGWGNDTASLQRIVRRLSVDSFNEKDVEVAVVSRLTINVNDNMVIGIVMVSGVACYRFLDFPFRPFMFSVEYVHHVPFLERRTIHFGNSPKSRAENSQSGTRANRCAKKRGG